MLLGAELAYASKWLRWRVCGTETTSCDWEQALTNRIETNRIENELEVTARRIESSVSEMSADAAEALQSAGGSNSVEAQEREVEVSAHFIGRWSELISTTNWEKGKIISLWRDTLREANAPSSAYSDEAWCRCVGGVTPQHVGRLRRVYDRFQTSYTSFAGLYWSHFLAALDWDDAEMWLEGATQSKWSVSQMRRTRWEAMGGDPAAEPREADIVASTDDEDFTPLAEADDATGMKDAPRSVAEGPRPDGPDFGDEDDRASAPDNLDDSSDAVDWEETEPVSSPFASLPSLPVDFAEALEQFKLAIIRHRSSSWSEVSQGDIVKALDALKLFVSM